MVDKFKNPDQDKANNDNDDLSTEADIRLDMKGFSSYYDKTNYEISV